MAITGMNISQSDDTDLLTSDDVIQRLSIDSALRRRAVTCVLPAVRCGNEWRFRREDLDAWIVKQQAPAS
jgi:hypothetical protein